MTTPFRSVKYEKKGKIAYITLDRPDRLNAIDDYLPYELKSAVELANNDSTVHVIILSGSGKGFCGGYDLKQYAENPGYNPGFQEMPWDPLKDYQMMKRNTECFMSLWRSLKPVICKVHGAAVGGGSDIALCCDLVLMADDAVIGYPPARVWGCPTTSMWVYRIGAEKAKRMMLTGDLISGTEAAKIGLVYASYPESELNDKVTELANKMAEIPINQLMMHKLVINQVYENMGIENTQILATVMDGIARHTPEGVEFKNTAERLGFKEAIRRRDSIASKL